MTTTDWIGNWRFHWMDILVGRVLWPLTRGAGARAASPQVTGK